MDGQASSAPPPPPPPPISAGNAPPPKNKKEEDSLDLSSTPPAKLMSRFPTNPTKWKQLPFPGAKTSPSIPKPKSSSSNTTTTAVSAAAAAAATTTNPPIQSPSPIKKNSRKAPSSPPTTTSSPAKKRSRPSPTTGFSTSTSISRSNNGSGGGSGGRYAPPSKYSSINNLLTDSITPNLFTLFIGLNPGIQTATSGHAYAHPSNLFWRLLHRSGCTPRQCHPSEDGDMPRLYNLGLTNIVTRPTRDGAELSKAEMDEGVAELERKIALYRPESVALVGKSIWESVWRVRHGRGIKKGEFRYGWQEEGERMGKGTGKGTGTGTGRGRGKGGFFGGGAVKEKEGDRAAAAADDADEKKEKGDEDKKWIGARVFVATTTSGLAASMSLKEKEEIWTQLGSWVEERRAERKQAATTTITTTTTTTTPAADTTASKESELDEPEDDDD